MRKLRRLRAKKGLTMDALEERTGVSKRTISEIERGMRAPQVLTLAKLAGALGVDIDELQEEEISKDQAPLPLELEEQGEANKLPGGSEPLYNSYEALGRVLASIWKVELEEWVKKIPEETSPSVFDIGRLFEWVVGIRSTKRGYEAIAGDAYDPPRTELQDTLRLMDDAYEGALQKCLKVLKPAKEYTEFRKIVEDNDLEAILGDVQLQRHV